MTLLDDIKKHQDFIDAIGDYVDECIVNKVSVEEIEKSILKIVREHISKKESKN